MLLELIRGNLFMNHLNEKDLMTIVMALQSEKIDKDSIIISEGDDGEFF